MSLYNKEERCRELARSVIGTSLKIRFEENASVTGKIVECEFAGWADRDTTKIARWKIVLECNTFKHTFHIRKLPKTGLKEIVEIKPENFKDVGFGNWCGVSS